MDRVLQGVIHIGGTGELSCALDPRVQGRGIPRDAVRMALLEYHGLPVWARTENRAVSRGLQQLGFTKDQAGIYRLGREENK